MLSTGAQEATQSDSSAPKAPSSPQESTFWGSILGLVALSFAIFFALSPGMYLGDDAFITLAYSKNLASGHGATFHPGEWIWGYTSPLQMLLLAAVEALGLDAITGASVLAALELGGACVLLWWVLRRFVSSSVLIGLVPLLLPAFHIFHGLEGTLVVFLAMATVAFAVAQRWTLMAVSAALACLARPDAILLVLPLLLNALGRRHWRGWACFAAIGTLWCIVALWAYGSVLPNTLGAKAGQTGFFEFVRESFLWVTEPYGLGHELSFFARFALLALSLCPILLPEVRARFVLWYPFVVFPWVLIAGYGWIGPPTFYKWEIYSAHFFFIASVVLGALACVHRLAALVHQRRRLQPIPLVTVGTAFCVVLATLLPRTLGTWSDLESNFIVAGRYHTYRAIADWAEARLPDGARLGHVEVGTLGYFTQRTTLVDLAGLVTERPATTRGLGGRELTDTMRQHHRPFFVLFPGNEPYRRSGELLYEQLYAFPDYGYTRFSIYRELRQGSRPGANSANE